MRRVRCGAVRCGASAPAVGGAALFSFLIFLALAVAGFGGFGRFLGGSPFIWGIGEWRGPAVYMRVAGSLTLVFGALPFGRWC